MFQVRQSRRVPVRENQRLQGRQNRRTFKKAFVRNCQESRLRGLSWRVGQEILSKFGFFLANGTISDWVPPRRNCPSTDCNKVMNHANSLWGRAGKDEVSTLFFKFS